MRGGAAAVLGGGAAAVFGVGGAAVFGVGGAARRLFAQSFGGALAPLGSPPCFAAVILRAGLCTVFCGSHSACRTLRRTFMPGARQNY